MSHVQASHQISGNACTGGQQHPFSVALWVLRTCVDHSAAVSQELQGHSTLHSQESCVRYSLNAHL